MIWIILFGEILELDFSEAGLGSTTFALFVSGFEFELMRMIAWDWACRRCWDEDSRANDLLRKHLQEKPTGKEKKPSKSLISGKGPQRVTPAWSRRGLWSVSYPSELVLSRSQRVGISYSYTHKSLNTGSSEGYNLWALPVRNIQATLLQEPETVVLCYRLPCAWLQKQKPIKAGEGHKT